MSRKWINIIKTVSALLWLYLISIQIRQSMHQIDLTRLDFFRFMTVLLWVLILAPINWCLEAIRWQTLIKKYKKVSFTSSFRSVMMGYAVGLMTPMNLGDYAGRAIGYEGAPQEAMVTTFYSGVWQNLIHYLLGALGTFYLYHYSQNKFLPAFTGIAIMAGVISIMIILFNNRVWDFFIHLIRLFRIQLKNIERFPFKINKFQNQNSRIFLFSCLRYGIYFTQYCILWKYCIPSADIVLILVAVVSLLYIFSLIPLPSFFGLLSKTQVSIFIFNLIHADAITASCITSMIWLSNIALASLIGIVFILQLSSTRMYYKLSNS